MVRVLLTGTTGFLGAFLEAELQHREMDLVEAGRRKADLMMDLDEPGSIRDVVKASGADLILNAAACANLADCAQDPARAKRVNGEAVAELADCGLRMLQVSTDLVFSGLEGPYLPTAKPAPLHVYGESKLMGEAAALAAGALVVRLPLLFAGGRDRAAPVRG
jgi:dTDP-4-dehydrorhamnose reductase